AQTPFVPPWQVTPMVGSPDRSSAASMSPSQSLSMPSQISTPLFVGQQLYSQPVATIPSRSCQQLFMSVQSQLAITHAVLVLSQLPPPVCLHCGVPWSTTQLFPHLPQSLRLVQRSTSSSFTPSQSSSL